MERKKKKEESEYSRLLKDARWQKKRLEVMQRDNFTCQNCGRGLNDGIVLNVHHIRYRRGLLPWEYNDCELITLCEDCHCKTHEKKKPIKKEEKIVRKENFAPFYRNLLFREDLTPCEKIVISYLIMLEDFNNLDGKKVNHTNIAKALCLSRRTVLSTMNRLESIGICDKNKRVIIKNDFTTRGYFELVKKDKLKGDLLIFYSYLLEKSKRYGYSIDTYKYKLAEEFGKTQIAITKLLNRLYKVGLASRLPNGKLLINTNKTLSQ